MHHLCKTNITYKICDFDGKQAYKIIVVSYCKSVANYATV